MPGKTIPREVTAIFVGTSDECTPSDNRVLFVKKLHSFRETKEATREEQPRNN